MNQSTTRQPGQAAQDTYSLGRWNKPTVTGLEADLAYFTARIELVSNPTTINQKIQLMVFRALAQSTQKILKHLQQH
jgi:hypothetical protein